MVERNSKSAFWKALIFTIVIFGIGMVIGVIFENSRSNEVERNLMNSEINLIDEQVRASAIDTMNLDCEDITKGTFDFADRIYWEANQLEDYDVASKFTNFLSILHKRYDLLRFMVWSESIKIKGRCGNNFHTVVYLYDYDTGDINNRALQNSMSNLLLGLKESHPDEVLLIPMAVNLKLASVDMVVKSYNIKEFPAIMIDEKNVVTGMITSEELEELIFGVK